MYDGIIIWEVGKPGSNNPEFREITRTPPSLWEDFRRKEDIPPGILRLNGFDFQGISDLVCITYAKVKQVLVYNLSENIWRWFGRREIEEHERTDSENPLISTFQPRLHMKVE
jgi:predicted membrane metal-binding protein